MDYIQDMHAIMEARNASDERTTQRISLKNINSIIKTEENKHGKKSREYQLINKLRQDGYSDIAIYLAMALSQTKLAPGWSIDDIMGEIEDPKLINKKYHKYLSKGYQGGEDVLAQKKLAMDMWKQVIEGEGKEQLKFMGVTEKMPKQKTRLAHEVLTHPGDQLSKIQNAIISGLDILQKIAKADPDYKLDIKKYFTYDPEGNISTTQYVNSLAGGGKGHASAPPSLPQELLKISREYELDDKANKLIKDINNVLNNAHDILWPEYEKPIKSIEDLKRYFNTLKSSKERARGEKVLKQYKKSKIEKPRNEVDKQYDKIIQSAVTDLETIPMSLEPEKFRLESEKIAKQLLKENDWLKDYVMHSESLPDDATDDEVITELAANMAFEYSKRKKHVGRRKDIWK